MNSTQRPYWTIGVRRPEPSSAGVTIIAVPTGGRVPSASAIASRSRVSTCAPAIGQIGIERGKRITVGALQEGGDGALFVLGPDEIIAAFGKDHPADHLRTRSAGTGRRGLRRGWWWGRGRGGVQAGRGPVCGGGAATLVGGNLWIHLASDASSYCNVVGAPARGADRRSPGALQA